MKSADDLETQLRALLDVVAAGAGEPPPIEPARLRRARFTQVSYVGGLIVAVAALVMISAWGFRTLSAPPQIDPIRPGPMSPSPAPRPTGMFTLDVTIHGWRFASTEILRQEGLDRDLKLDCTPQQVRSSTRTELDFELTYVPSGMELSGGPEMKWVCGSMTLSVDHEYTLSPSGGLRIQRFVLDKRGWDLGSVESIEPCEIRGLRAVCALYAKAGPEPASTTIVVIEDDNPDPFLQLLTISTHEIPYEEVLKIVEGIR